MGQGNDIHPKEEVDVKETSKLGSSDETLTVSVKMTENDDGSNGPTEILVSKRYVDF